MVFLYEVLLYLVFILGLPFFMVIGLVRGKYLANLRERFGVYPSRPRAHDLWIHAVSVGEALAAKPVVDEILRVRPQTSIVFTTTTITGQAQAKRLFPRAAVTYFPFDFTLSVNRFLTHHTPQLFATMETEIWPNVTRLSKRRGVRLVLANGRISDRSYPRYRRFRAVVARVLRRYDRILAREELDRERFIAIGAPPEIVEVTGNVKFDFAPDLSPLPFAAELQRLSAGRHIAVLGSTIEGEDELLAATVRSLAKAHDVFFVVAPRKPERFDAAVRIYEAAGLRVVRRSALTTAPASADVLVIDTLGELARLYRHAEVAFIGGSLVAQGGHNPIEAAVAGVPVCFGPSMSNFREIAAVFVRSEAAAVVHDVGEFRDFVTRMTADAALRRAWGDRARETVSKNRGASERSARRILELLP